MLIRLLVIGALCALIVLTPCPKSWLPIQPAGPGDPATRVQNDPLDDAPDIVAYHSPGALTILAGYAPGPSPEAGPATVPWYALHIKTRSSVGVPGSAADELIYRFSFSPGAAPGIPQPAADGAPGATCYSLERSLDGGQTYAMILANGIVPAKTVRSNAVSDLAALLIAYDKEVDASFEHTATGERVFVGAADDALSLIRAPSPLSLVHGIAPTGAAEAGRGGPSGAFTIVLQIPVPADEQGAAGPFGTDLSDPVIHIRAAPGMY